VSLSLSSSFILGAALGALSAKNKSLLGEKIHIMTVNVTTYSYLWSVFPRDFKKGIVKCDIHCRIPDMHNFGPYFFFFFSQVA
jgi:hypothetical protein